MISNVKLNFNYEICYSCLHARRRVHAIWINIYTELTLRRKHQIKFCINLVKLYWWTSTRRRKFGFWWNFCCIFFCLKIVFLLFLSVSVWFWVFNYLQCKTHYDIYNHIINFFFWIICTYFNFMPYDIVNHNKVD